MKQRIEFKNPQMKQYEKQSGGMLPMLIVLAVLFLAGRYLFGAETHLPHMMLTRYLPTGGEETLMLECQPEAAGPHFFCRVEKMRNQDSVATVIIEEATATKALGHFFKRWPAQGPTRSTASGRKSLSWTVSDGEHTVNGEATWRDAAMDKQTSAILSLEGELGAQLSK